MAVDISKQGTKGGDQHYDTSQLRGVREERGIVTGVVKANVHGAHMGVIKIWVPTFSTNPDDRSQWRTVRYCTPFYSRVDNQGVGDTYLGTKVTSGIITPPPDLGTKVLAFFRVHTGKRDVCTYPGNEKQCQGKEDLLAQFRNLERIGECGEHEIFERLGPAWSGQFN